MSEVSENAMTIIGVLLQRLGGEVVLTDEECYAAVGGEVLSRRTSNGDLQVRFHNKKVNA